MDGGDRTGDTSRQDICLELGTEPEVGDIQVLFSNAFRITEFVEMDQCRQRYMPTLVVPLILFSIYDTDDSLFKGSGDGVPDHDDALQVIYN